MASVIAHGMARLVIDQPSGLEIRDSDDERGAPASLGNPYTEGLGNFNNGGGADGQHMPSATEIGIIIGVVFLVLAGIAALFYRRVQKRKHLKDAEAAVGFIDNHISATRGDDPSTTSKKIEDDRTVSSTTAGDSALHFEVRKSQSVLQDGRVGPNCHSQDDSEQLKHASTRP